MTAEALAQDLALVVDVGTSVVKAALLDADGAVHDQASAPLTTHTAAGGVVEQDAGDWWRAAGEAVRGLAAGAGAERVDAARAGVRRVILTGQMQNLTLVDGDGRALRPTLLYGDVRARAEAHEVEEAVGGDRLVALTANTQDAAGLLAKAAWLRRHEPVMLDRARRLFLGAADVLAFRLTGVAACDTTTASTTGLMAFDARRPLPGEVFEALGLGDLPRLLPRFVPGGAEVGRLLPEPAEAWGLPAGLPVHLGPGDAGATTVGAGSGEPGVASGYIGSSGWVAFSAANRGDPERGVFTLAHPAPGRTIQIAPLLTAGGNLAWAVEALGAGANPGANPGVDPGVAATEAASTADYGRAIDRALARPPARLLYLPYLQGERSPFRDPLARAAFIGIDAATTRDDLVRAVLEGVAFAYRHALQALMPGDEPGSVLVLSGGGTRSEGWCRLVATVVGRSVRVQDEPESVGLRGALRSVQAYEGQAADFAVPVHGRVFTPDPSLRVRYDQLFETFRSAHEDLANIYRGLTATAGEAPTR